MMVACAHTSVKKHGRDRKGNQRVRCLLCGKTWVERKPKPLGVMRVPVADAKRALHLLTEGMSVRGTARTTGLSKKTILKLIVHFGKACREFLDARMQNLTLDHLQFDEQWTYVFKKQSRLPVDDRRDIGDQGDIYLWTCVDQRTKLMPSFRIGKRTGDNARRFMHGRFAPARLAQASRKRRPRLCDGRIQAGLSKSDGRLCGLSRSGGPGVWSLRANTARSSSSIAMRPMIYTPSEMVGTERTARRGMLPKERVTICTSHVERLNGTQRLFLKRLNRLTYCFSKKLGQPRSGFRHVRGMVQLLLADSEAGQVWQVPSDRCRDERPDGSYLDVR